MVIDLHSFQRELSVPHPHPEAPEVQQGGSLHVISPGLPLALDYPRGIVGAETGPETKGSTFPSQSDVSDRNAGRRDNLQTSTGTQDTS